ncbi:MAG: hypothetical protein ACR2JD_02680 [Nocardioides sp.]
MGSDDFLDEGAPMEVFSSQNFGSGRATTLWIAGVTSGDSFMWADLPGDLAKVVAYDAAGSVIEDHALKPCDNQVECEAR